MHVLLSTPLLLTACVVSLPPSLTPSLPDVFGLSAAPAIPLPLLSLHTEQGSPGARPGCPRSSCRARWLELFPGLRPQRAPLCHRVTASLGASFGRTGHLARVQLKCSAWEAVALESRVLWGVLVIYTCMILDEGCSKDPVPSIVPTTQQALTQRVVMEIMLGASHCCIQFFF